MALKNTNTNMTDSGTAPLPKLKKRSLPTPTSPVGPSAGATPSTDTGSPVLRNPRKTITPVNPPVRRMGVISNKPHRPLGSDALTKRVRTPNLGGKPVSAPTPISGTANARKPGAEIPAPVKPKTQKQSTDPWKTGW